MNSQVFQYKIIFPRINYAPLEVIASPCRMLAIAIPRNNSSYNITVS